MLFSSITFLYFFLPVTLVISFLTPKKYKNLVLLIASFLFYGWSSPRYLLLLIAVILTGYMAGIVIEKRHFAGGFAIGLFVLCLMICKYVPWLSKLGNHGTNGIVPVYQWVLPIGISFYTFQMISYVYDVSQKRIQAEKNLIHLATYISMFPQLIAGPIVRYETVQKEMQNRKMTWDQFAIGVRRFIIGLSKKVLLADVLGELVAALRAMDGKNTAMYWYFMIAFSLQLYLDFSGYSDMAIGLGGMLGFTIPENFRYPFISKSITEFWRRWHISLSSWFRDYVYIPLGGNRVSLGRWMVNMLIVWGLSGLWHGAGGHFLVWGLYFGVWLILEKRWLHGVLDKCPCWLQHIYTLLVVLISFIFFQMDTMQEAFQVLTGMFGFGQTNDVTMLYGTYQMKKYMLVLVIGSMASTPISVKLVQVIKEKSRIGNRILWFIEPFVLFGLLIIVTAFLLNSSFHPFLYFRF